MGQGIQDSVDVGIIPKTVSIESEKSWMVDNMGREESRRSR